MTIEATDIKLLASERMSDTSDGGGRRTSNVIPDGVAGNIFPKVSRLDSAYGRVNLRKIYGAVSTANLDVYAGAHAVIMDAPDNDKIHAALFSTGSDFDDRTAARDRIESYVIAGPESRMVLYGRQLVGQGAVLIYQRPEEPLPEVGDVYCLSKETGSVTNYQQFVRVTDVEHEVRNITDPFGAFSARVVTLRIGSPLRYEFVGPLSPSRLSDVARGSIMRLTTVADAARYYGLRKMQVAADASDLEVKVDSIYTQIVPTTQRESAVSNAQMTGTTAVRKSAQADIAWALVSAIQGFSEGGAGPAGQLGSIRTNMAIAPGSLKIRLTSYGGLNDQPTANIVDDGLGNILTGGNATRWIASGTVDYAAGVVNYKGVSLAPFGTQVWATFIPGAKVSQPAHSLNIPITLATRGTVYAQTLRPLPEPGALIVAYRALGKWYELRDNGNGEVGGVDAAYGTGSIDYTTGALVVTLGALPDVSSAIIVHWGSPVHTTPRADAMMEPPVWRHTLPDTGVVPGSVTVSWDITLRDGSGNVTGSLSQTLTDDVAGNLTGDGIGRIVYATGEMWFLPKRLPDPGSTPVVDYERDDMVEEAFTPSLDGNGMASMTLTDLPIAGTVQLLWQTIRAKTTSEKSGAGSSQVTYPILPVPNPPAVLPPLTVGGGNVSLGNYTWPDSTVQVSPSPVEPVAENVTVPTGTTYPLIGVTFNNTLGLPVKFQQFPTGAILWSTGYRIDVANGWFVVAIHVGTTKWGGVQISAADILPVSVGALGVVAPMFTSFPNGLGGA